MQRSQPDQLAVAFMKLAFDLPEGYSGLSNWLTPVVKQAGLEFPGTLARIAFDMAYLSGKSGRAIEQATVKRSTSILNWSICLKS